MSKDNDFSKGSVSKSILKLAVPMTLAQLINILYNIVDRMYIGRIPNASSLALTGVGVTFPIITIIMAFANLYGMGGAPLCSIERGKGNNKKAEEIMGNSFTLLMITGLILTIIILIFKKP
ncbi:MATE family efflux transporter, partial [Clostridium sp.]